MPKQTNLVSALLFARRLEGITCSLLLVHVYECTSKSEQLVTRTVYGCVEKIQTPSTNRQLHAIKYRPKTIPII